MESTTNYDHRTMVIKDKSGPFSLIGFSSCFTLICLVSTLLYARYTFLCHRFSRVKEGAPPTVPYIFPFLGSIPLGYLRQPRDFVLSSQNFFGLSSRSSPLRVKIFNHEIYIVQGAGDIKALFKNSWTCTSTFFAKFAIGHAFGAPPKALDLYDKDDSGGGSISHPDSSVEPRNRIDHNVHESLARLLEGPGLQPFWLRFVDEISTRLDEDRKQFNGSSWQNIEDLSQFVVDAATLSFVNALCGPHLLCLNPGFVKDFWEFDRNLQTYLRGTPRVFAPRAYACRERLLVAVKKWQRYARENCSGKGEGVDDDEPFWGSSFFRKRQAMFLNMDGYDYDAIASQDLGAIWAGRNSIASSSWMAYEIFRDPELLSNIRAEVTKCIRSKEDAHIWFDIDDLLQCPVLQAVYAETLLLRMHFYIIRMPDRVDLKIRRWIIPRRKVVVTSTTCAHFDDSWPTGVDNEHPVDTFWAGRFLGPSKDLESSCGHAPLVFSTKDFEGLWIPYGGGPRQCPGRHFAKRQILLTTALLVILFDCEILGAGKDIEEDLSLSAFGSGISLPAAKVPVRMRRRQL